MSQAIDAPAWQNCAGCGEVVPDRPEMCLACGQPEPEEQR